MFLFEFRTWLELFKTKTLFVHCRSLKTSKPVALSRTSRYIYIFILYPLILVKESDLKYFLS